MKNKALAAPYLVWMAIFTVVPLGIVIWFSFTDSITGAFTFDNISRMGTYLPIFLKSIWLAILSSLICLVIGYPVAYCLASAAPERQRHGIGTALLRAVLERFNGVRQIELTTDDTPETAAFYRSLGFADFADLGCRGFMLD